MKIDITIKELAALLIELKKTIDDECRVSDDEDDDTPGMQITIGYTQGDNVECSSWDYQTGDNSYSGGAYLHPTWGIGHLYRTSNCRETAKEIIADIIENLPYEK